ncbi:unnamed protein product [Urochloa humidicola]
MAREWSASASNQGTLEGLPLITCSECGRAQVVRRKSKQEWSLGEVFYCCPFHKRDGTGCPFWFWEQDYKNMLKRIHVIGEDSMQDNSGDPQRRPIRRDQVKEAKKDDISNEVVRLLQSIRVLCVCILAVQVVMLLAQLLKN